MNSRKMRTARLSSAPRDWGPCRKSLSPRPPSCGAAGLDVPEGDRPDKARTPNRRLHPLEQHHRRALLAAVERRGTRRPHFAASERLGDGRSGGRPGARARARNVVAGARTDSAARAGYVTQSGGQRDSQGGRNRRSPPASGSIRASPPQARTSVARVREAVPWATGTTGLLARAARTGGSACTVLARRRAERIVDPVPAPAWRPTSRTTQPSAHGSPGTAPRGPRGLPGGRGLNIAHEAVDRHAAGRIGPAPRSGSSARTAPGPWTWERLRRVTNRFAQRPGEPRRVQAHGVRPARACPRALRGGLRRAQGRSVVLPLFSAIGPNRSAAPDARARSRARDHAQYVRTQGRTLAGRAARARPLLLVDGEGTEAEGVHGLAPLLERASGDFTVPATDRGSRAPPLPPAVRRGDRRGRSTCTRPSSRTARPRGTRSTSTRRTVRCTADPGGVTGTLLRHRRAAGDRRDSLLVDEAEFDRDAGTTCCATSG